MINFFKRIRQQLISENKTGKYFKYAIGEIVLVVIGILIALTINNWNEDRKRANAESQSLVELLAEFNKNHKDLMSVHFQKSKAADSLSKYLEFINNDIVFTSEKNRIFYMLAGNTWNTQYSVLNGLTNSGAINNLKNDILRGLLNTWNDYLDNYLEQQTYYHKTILQNYRDFIIDKTPNKYQKFDITLESWDTKYFESEEELKAYAIKIVPDLEYQNLLKECLRRLYIQLYNMKPLIENYYQIVALLEEEINSKK